MIVKQYRGQHFKDMKHHMLKAECLCIAVNKLLAIRLDGQNGLQTALTEPAVYQAQDHNFIIIKNDTEVRILQEANRDIIRYHEHVLNVL